MKKRITLKVFIPLYLKQAQANLKPKSYAEYNRLINTQITPFFGKHCLHKISTQEIEEWHLDRREDAAVQANRSLAVFSAILRLAARWGYIQVNPAHGISSAKEKARESYLTPEARERFLGAAYQQDPVNCAYLLCLYYTGARPGELCSAQRAWLTPTTLELPDSKTGRRTIFLPPEAQKAISTLPVDPSGLLFPGVNPSTLWRRVRQTAELWGYRLYDLRHSFASAALEAGVNLESISQLLGHSSPITTRRYIHLSTAAGSKAAEDAAKVLSQRLNISG